MIKISVIIDSDYQILDGNDHREVLFCKVVTKIIRDSLLISETDLWSEVPSVDAMLTTDGKKTCRYIYII